MNAQEIARRNKLKYYELDIGLSVLNLFLHIQLVKLKKIDESI